MSTRRISVRKQGLIVKITIVECHNSYSKIFESEANTNNQSQVNDLLLAAYYKGMSLPEEIVTFLMRDYDAKDNKEKWW